VQLELFTKSRRHSQGFFFADNKISHWSCFHRLPGRKKALSLRELQDNLGRRRHSYQGMGKNCSNRKRLAEAA